MIPAAQCFPGYMDEKHPEISRHCFIKICLCTEALCRGGTALFAVAHLTSTPATRSPEWRLSVTLYQLPHATNTPSASPLFVCVLTVPILPPLLSEDCFSPFLAASLTLLPSVALSSRFYTPSPSSLASFCSNWLSLKLSSHILLSPPQSLSWLFLPIPRFMIR